MLAKHSISPKTLQDYTELVKDRAFETILRPHPETWHRWTEESSTWGLSFRVLRRQNDDDGDDGDDDDDVVLLYGQCKEDVCKMNPKLCS